MKMTQRLRKPGRLAPWMRAALPAGVSCLMVSGCYLPGAQSGLSLTQSVNATASQCDPDVARGQITNNAPTAIQARLKVTWISVTNKVLASATVPVARVPAHGTASWSARPSRSAPGAISCDATLSGIRVR